MVPLIAAPCPTKLALPKVNAMASAHSIPATQYAESDGLSIAYQVFGNGAKDLIVVPPILSHIELNWEYPAYASMLRRLEQTFRVIMFDKRGQGLSDRFEGVPTLEQRMDDMRDVMRAGVDYLSRTVTG